VFIEYHLCMALPADVQIVSVDDHVIEHANVWQDRLPQKYKEAGPKNIRDDAGHDAWWFEGESRYNIGLNAVAAFQVSLVSPAAPSSQPRTRSWPQPASRPTTTG
jgi:hypothetical protein